MEKLYPESELSRLSKLSVYENRLFFEGCQVIAGVDEAGRGSLAGPVVAAACALPRNFFLAYLNDSKLLTPSMRQTLYTKIVNYPGISFGIGICEAATIDKINILEATFIAMKEAVSSLPLKAEYLLVDGRQVPNFGIPCEAIVRGDQLSVSIAAASILAKVTRDQIMIEYDARWPCYGFKRNKGYGSKEHRDAIWKWGSSSLHRKSFGTVKAWIEQTKKESRVNTL